MKNSLRKTKTQKRKTQRGGYNAESTPIQPSVMYSKSSPKVKSKSHKKTHRKYPKRK